MIGEYPDLEPGRLNDCRLDCDISRLEGRLRWDEVGLCVGVRGGEDMIERIIVESQDSAKMLGASELGKV